MEGLLEPTIREVRLGAAEVRDTFKISKVGTIAGCYVTDGKVNRHGQVRLLRDNVVVHTGKVSSLKRFKDDACEVKAGTECGIGIDGYNDIKPGDVIEFFTTEKVKEIPSTIRRRQEPGGGVDSAGGVLTARGRAASMVSVRPRLHFPAARPQGQAVRRCGAWRQRIRNRFNVSVAEVEHQDLWQRARLAVVSVNTDHAHLESTLQSVAGEAETARDILLDATVEVLVSVGRARSGWARRDPGARSRHDRARAQGPADRLRHRDPRRLTPDLRSARVYVGVLGDKASADKSLAGSEAGRRVSCGASSGGGCACATRPRSSSSTTRALDATDRVARAARRGRRRARSPDAEDDPTAGDVTGSPDGRAGGRQAARADVPRRRRPRARGPRRRGASATPERWIRSRPACCRVRRQGDAAGALPDGGRQELRGDVRLGFATTHRRLHGRAARPAERSSAPRARP